MDSRNAASLSHAGTEIARHYDLSLTCQLEESVAKRLASEFAYALGVARPVLGDAVITLLRVERLDHDTVDASKRARGL